MNSSAVISSAPPDDEYDDVVYSFTRRRAEGDGGANYNYSGTRVEGTRNVQLCSLPIPPLDEEEVEDLPAIGRPIKHFLHRHILTPYQLRVSDERNCRICSLTISGNAHGCKSCHFYIDELCSKFPQHIHHAAHRPADHTLELRPTRSVRGGFTCKACGEGTDEPDERGHQRSPVFMVHYGCVSCEFALHITCAAVSTSLTVRHNGALHNLYTNFPLRNELGDLNCHLCRLEIPREYMWVFFSRNPERIFHFTCLADELHGRARYKELINAVTASLKEIETGRPWMRMSLDALMAFLTGSHREICHEHFLIEWSNIEAEAICQLCGSSINNDDKYGCKECNYYFHENCSRIPQEIHHPGHVEHHLTLVCPRLNGKKICSACGISSNSFSYACFSCEFYIYPRCASYPQALSINVSGNSKRFNLVQRFPYRKEALEIKCDKCGGSVSKGAWMYYNKETELRYHMKCAAEKANLDLEWTAAIARLKALEVG